VSFSETCCNADNSKVLQPSCLSSIVLALPVPTRLIQVGWWHHVHTLDVSIMVSYTNFCFPNEFDWFSPAITPSSINF
jgi:hypothetical protein